MEMWKLKGWSGRVRNEFAVAEGESEGEGEVEVRIGLSRPGL